MNAIPTSKSNIGEDRRGDTVGAILRDCPPASGRPKGSGRHGDLPLHPIPYTLYPLVGLGGLLLVLVLTRYAFRPRTPAIPRLAPDADTVFTSTRTVTCLLSAPDGSLWAGTTGGILRRDPSGSWRKFTRRDGLPSNEVRSLTLDGATVKVELPTTTARYLVYGVQYLGAQDNSYRNAEHKTSNTASVVWNGQIYNAALDGLHIIWQGKTRTIALPPCRATHVSALLLHKSDTEYQIPNTELWAGLFGDGIWRWNGRAWQRLSLNLPNAAREITSLAEQGDTLWIGTRRDGLWQGRNGQWTQAVLPGEPLGHNCQAIAAFHGRLFVSTLEDGLAIKTPSGWGHAVAPTLASNAPRAMTVFQNTLFLRHGDGRVDLWDGKQWRHDVFTNLPHRQASALAADENRLYVGQWGGWSEWDGAHWTHRLDVPELAGVPVTVLCPQGDTLWVGTQNRGLAEVNRVTGNVRWHDERLGLPDDWITNLAVVNQSLYAGTFVGGLARWNGARWITYPQLNGENVTALEPDNAGGLYVATRRGVWHCDATNALARVQVSGHWLDSEAQSLCLADGALWIGTRTGLYVRKGK